MCVARSLRPLERVPDARVPTVSSPRLIPFSSLRFLDTLVACAPGTWDLAPGEAQRQCGHSAPTTMQRTALHHALHSPHVWSMGDEERGPHTTHDTHDDTFQESQKEPKNTRKSQRGPIFTFLHALKPNVAWAVAHRLHCYFTGGNLETAHFTGASSSLASGPLTGARKLDGAPAPVRARAPPCVPTCGSCTCAAPCPPRCPGT